MPFVTGEGGDLLYQPMPNTELSAARREFGLTRIQFGQLLGMTGKNGNIYVTVKRYEEGQREIGPMIERLVTLLLWFKADHGHLPDLDRKIRQAAEIAGAAE